MGRKRTPILEKPVDLHIRLPHDLNKTFNEYMIKNKALTKTEVIVRCLNNYLKNLY